MDTVVQIRQAPEANSDPDPANWSRSDRIRIHNTGRNISRICYLDGFAELGEADNLPPVEEHCHHRVRAAEHLTQHPAQQNPCLLESKKRIGPVSVVDSDPGHFAGSGSVSESKSTM